MESSVLNPIRHSQSEIQNPTWLKLPDNWQAKQQTVDVFAIDFEQPPITIDRAKTYLSDMERDRVERFKSPQRQREFTLTRALLRMVLASVIRIDPLALHFEHTSQGKPFLPDDTVHFNVTHSHDIALIAVSPDLPLGVDIEYMQPRDAFMKLAQRFFAPAEFEAVCQLPQSLQLAAFHATWTRKEAFVKATAKGIALGLDRFEVSVDPQAEAKLLKCPAEITEPWHLRDLPSPAPDYVACLCTAHASPAIHCWQLTPATCIDQHA
jgi:4'-phosphopantetheinyl transferase